MRLRWLLTLLALSTWAECDPDVTSSIVGACSWHEAISAETGTAPYLLTRQRANSERWHGRRYALTIAEAPRPAYIVIPREEVQRDEDADAAAGHIADQWARLPRLVHLLWPDGAEIELDLDTHGGLSWASTGGAGVIKIGFDGDPAFFSNGYRHHPWTEEMLLHEFAHMLDSDGGWYLEDEWAVAAEKDNAHVTRYAATSTGEDFAESFTAWLLYRAYPHRLSVETRRHTRETMTARIHYFDRRLRYFTLRRPGSAR